MPPVKGQMWSYTEEDMLKAIQDVKSGISVNKAAKDNGVARTTLRAKISGKSPLYRRMGPPTVLTRYEEDILEEWVKEMSRAGFPVTTEQLQTSVQQIVKEYGRETPFTDGKPGKTWLTSFLRRHPSISKRVAENLTLSRASVGQEQVMGWFTEIELYLRGNNFFDILKDPHRNFNGDESAFFLNPKGNKVLASRGQKAVYLNVNSDEKECLTVLVTASAAGVMAPPMVVFKYERIPVNVIRSVPKGWGIGKSENGWMTQATFFEYVTNIFHPWLVTKQITLPVILFVDGHTSHLTLHLSNFCQKNGIILIALYPNTTHFMQPMDVSVFKALKQSWKVKVHDWRLQHIDHPILKKTDFCRLLEEVLDETMTQTIVSNGFRKCGLVPWNPKAIALRGNPTEDRNEQLGLDSKQVRLALNVLEELIDVEKQTLFKSCEPASSWTGNTEDASLFKIWKTMDALANRQEKPEVLRPMTVDSSLVQEERSTLTSTFEASNLDMDIDTVDTYVYRESLLQELDVATTSDENLSSSIPAMIINVEAEIHRESLPPETVEAGSNNEIASPQTPSNLLPSPFKKCLLWPQEKINNNKKRNKNKIPSVVSSESYQDYLNKKQDAKLQQENERKRKAKERAQKKEEKEKIALKKKEMKATAKKLVKKTNNVKRASNNKKNARRNKKSDSTSEDDNENDVWMPSESEEQEMPSDANSDDEWSLHTIPVISEKNQSTSHDDNVLGGTLSGSTNQRQGRCENEGHGIGELIDDDELLRQADDFCVTFHDAVGEQEEECELSFGKELLQTPTENLHDDIPEQLEELGRTPRGYVAVCELPPNILKPDSPRNEKKGNGTVNEPNNNILLTTENLQDEYIIPEHLDEHASQNNQKNEIVNEPNDHPIEEMRDEFAIEQGDYIVAMIQGPKKLQKLACKVIDITEVGAVVVPLISCNRMRTLFKLTKTKVSINIGQVETKLCPPSKCGERNVLFSSRVDID